MAQFKKADLMTFAEKVIIFFTSKESPDHFPGFKTPPFHKNLQSAEVTSSKNKNSNVADNNFSPREGGLVRLKLKILQKHRGFLHQSETLKKPDHLLMILKSSVLIKWKMKILHCIPRQPSL